MGLPPPPRPPAPGQPVTTHSMCRGLPQSWPEETALSSGLMDGDQPQVGVIQHLDSVVRSMVL